MFLECVIIKCMIRIKEGPPTEGGKGVQYLFNIEVIELYECRNVMGRLGRVVLDALFYRQRLEKFTGC
jgi:hypothetical protein